MSTGGPRRDVFVISDLHIGGAYPPEAPDNAEEAPDDADEEPAHAKEEAPDDDARVSSPRGFRICTEVDALVEFVDALPGLTSDGAETELVINGDFVDFLAEEHDGQPKFLPFIANELDALRVFNAIADRDARLFTALAELASRHRLTILLGNHDLELAYPMVRAALVERLGGESERLSIRPYGEPYRVGDAVVEHGNRYDGFNSVTEEQLARLIEGKAHRDDVPPGSYLVAQLMNPLKRTFPFLDLVKPEEEAVIPLLLAIDPSVTKRLGKILLLKWRAEQRLRGASSGPGLESVSAGGLGSRATAPSERDALQSVLAEQLGGVEEAAEFTELIEAEDSAGLEAVASRTSGESFALLELIVRSPRRLEALWRALNVLHRDLSFHRGKETDPRYVEAAQDYPRDVRWVVLGHTHLAKEHTDVIPGRKYVNTGTWADLIPFPQHILREDPAEGRAQLRRFLEDLRAGREAPERLQRWIAFRPTYARLTLEGDVVTDAALRTYDERAREPQPPGRDDG